MSTLKTVTILHPSSAVNNIVNDASGNVALGNNLTVAGTSTLTGNVTATGTVAMGSSFKRNRIINGNMVIDQRNAGASVTPTDGQYSVDRWKCGLTQASKFSAQQNAGAVTPSAGFTNYLGVTSLSAYTVAAGDIFGIQQVVEGYNVADLNWGTSNAKTVTLSFQVYSSLTGTFGGVIRNSAQNRSYPFIYTVSSANTWTAISITIAGDTSGTWLTNTGYGLGIQWGLGVGSTYSGTAGAWAGTNYASATGAVSVVGTSGATFYITGVQLEVGTKATPYEMQIYSDQLAQCQRYYQIGQFGQAGYILNLTGMFYHQTLAVNMRAAPTMATSSVSSTNLNSLALNSYAGQIQIYGIGASTGGAYYYGNFTASAEL